ncbi:chymotrypsin-1-like [Solenopsis invicta]|uniref:chymotrypsin-1-like n=1 Tax=Solenopsis invicta TaxID=13686 RepID=UPI000595E78A|nr:chymotrypsin-1-like [Solenopsis invicta]
MLPFIFLVVGVLAQQTFAEEPEAIVGGQPATPGEFPHQCSLRVNGNHICGCSIIGPTKILTAAHCVHGIAYPPYSNVKVAVGTISRTGGTLYDVLNVVVHPQYSDSSRDSWKNDVAVMTLKRPIQYNQYVQPIGLARSTPRAGQQCQLSGWGMTRANGPLADSLLKMYQGIVDRNQCQQIHRNMPLTGSHLCAVNQRGIGACQGDSGGPFICGGVQCGITSWVAPCAQGVPDVYTDVAYHYNFIVQN